MNKHNLSSRFHKTLSMMRINNCIRIFKPFGRSVSQNAVEAGCTEVRREGHVSTSRPPKSHVVDRHPFAEPPEGHAPTALCEITLRSYRTTNTVIANPVTCVSSSLLSQPYDQHRHREPSHPALGVTENSVSSLPSSA